jgi:hypothetical protein
MSISFNATAGARFVLSRRVCRIACASPRSRLSTIRAPCAAARRQTHSSPSDPCPQRFAGRLTVATGAIA